MRASLRNFPFFTLISFFFLVAPFSLIAQYCASSATTTFGAEIIQVTGTGQSMSINNSNSSGTCGAYMDNTYDTVDVTLGGTFALSVTLGSCSGQFEKTGQVYIDWNGDLDFDDAGENVATLSLFSNGVIPTPDMFNITVPVNAAPGYTRIRIVCVETSSALLINPCGSFSYGETEDYTLRINGYQNDVGVVSLVNPSFPACVMDSVVKVSIENSGTSALTSATINWSVNGSLQSSFSYSGSLTSYAIDTITLGTVNGGLNDGDTILIWASMANGISPDSNALNDSLTVVVFNSFSGTYLIDPSGAGDFLSFTDAVNALNNFGVCGPTIFEVADGTYNEQIELFTFTGMDSVNTVTFQSQSSNPDSVILAYSSTGSMDNFVVKMFDADYFMFEDLTIINLDTSSSRVFDMWGADNVSINNCKVISSGSGYLSSGLYSSYYNNGAYASCHNFRMTNSEIIGGYYGMYFYQNNNNRAQNAVIENNKFIDQYYRGVDIRYANDLQFNNNYLNSSSNYAFAYGFYFNFVIKGTISNNFVEGSTSWPLYGMYFATVSGDLATFMPIANNRVSMPNPVAGWGMYAHNNLFVNYAFNSVYMSGGSSTEGMHFSNGGYNKIKNNIVKVDGVNATAFSLTGSSIYEMDYNAFSAPNGAVGYSGGAAQTTLGDWVSTTGFDSNSVELLNVFSNGVTLKVCTDSLYGIGVSLPLYTYDFEGDLRQNPPCIGADEFLPISEFGFDDQTLCNGDTLILYQYYFDTVVWNTTDTSNTFVVVAPGPQSVAVYGECGSDTLYFSVDVQAMAFIGDTNLCEGTTAILQTGILNGTYLWSTGSTDSTLIVNSAQIVSVNVIDAYGCSSSDTAIITQSYDVSLPDSAFFCEGLSVDLDANMSGTYLWNNGSTNQVVTISVVGVYSVTVADQNCVSSSSSVVDEVLNPIAMFSDSSDHMTVVFTNTSQNATSYLWDFGDGTTSTQEHPTHIFPWAPNPNICYNVSMAAYNSCGVDTMQQVVCLSTIGVNEVLTEDVVQIYPNPNTGVFNVSVKTEEAVNMSVEVMDVRGWVVFTSSYGKVNGEVNRTINLENAAQGIYFVKVTLDDETAVYRVFVK